MTDGTDLPPARTVALLVAGGFAVGVQVRLLLLSGFGGYPPAGAEGVAWSTLLVLVGVVLVAASRLDARTMASAATAAVAAVGERVDDLDGAPAGTTIDPSDDEGAGAKPASAPQTGMGAGSLEVRLTSPFDAAPAVAPGEDVPVQVHLDRPGLEGAVRLRFAVREGGSRRVRHRQVEASRATWTVSFTDEGPVEIAVTADHPRVEAANARVSGVCRPYREAVGDVLDDLRSFADRRGLPADDGSTPRQVCRALEAGPSGELRDRLEAALYGDEAVSRETYLEAVRLADEVRDAVGGTPP